MKIKVELEYQDDHDGIDYMNSDTFVLVSSNGEWVHFCNSNGYKSFGMSLEDLEKAVKILQNKRIEND